MAFYPNDMLHYAYLTRVVNEKPSKEAIRQRYRGLEILPFDYTPERQIINDVIFSENPLAGFYGPRGQAIPGDEMLYSQEITTLADIKARRELDTWMSQQLADPGTPKVIATGTRDGRAKQAKLTEHINNRVSWCNETVDSQVEYMIMNALSSGSIVWPPVDNAGNPIANPQPHWNADYTINIPFNLPSAQNQAVTTLAGYGGRTGSGTAWTNVASTPLDDLAIINQYMLKTKGISMRQGRVLMSEIVLDHLSKNTSILNWLAGKNFEQPGARGYADPETIKTALQNRFGWTIEPYDAQWTYRVHVPGTKPTVNRIDFMKEGKIIFLPPGNMGVTLTTDQVTKDGQFVEGKYGWSVTSEFPPHDVTIGVDLVAWPKFDNYDWFILDAYN